MSRDYMTLLGAEEISRAGHVMKEAGSEMLRAAGYMDETLRRHQQFMDDWLHRLETTLAERFEVEE